MHAVGEAVGFYDKSCNKIKTQAIQVLYFVVYVCVAGGALSSCVVGEALRFYK
jgi:hypothetical protein